LFSGAGGLTLGFTGFLGQSFPIHSFHSIFANDYEKDAVATYNLNFGQHCMLGDITKILSDPKVVIPQADVVIGGPPCQGFSLLNKNRAGDARRQLWRPYFEVVERSGASVFVMENVPQLLTSDEFSEIYDYAVNHLGFKVTSAVLRAPDYGVSQMRQRAFIIGSQLTDPAVVFPPKKTHYKPGTPIARRLFDDNNEYVDQPEPWSTVRDAIGELPPPIGTEIRKTEAAPLDLHFGRNPTPLSMKRYRAIPHEGMNRFDLQARAPELTPECWINKKTGSTDLFGRLWWDKPALTIRTEFFKPEKGCYLHPEQHRPITHREAARLQSFPDTFKFCGSKIEVAKQIGNAVPPLLAARVAERVYALLLRQKDNLVIDDRVLSSSLV
jgi:DNA (cytosine-5)-methyltransferase 1